MAPLQQSNFQHAGVKTTVDCTTFIVLQLLKLLDGPKDLNDIDPDD